jgi:hypothetical protein
MFKVNRDVIIAAAVITLMVSSTAAWYFNIIVEPKTTEIVVTSETLFVVLQSSFVYLGKSSVELTLELQNSAAVPQSTEIEIQALDASGEIMLDDGGAQLIQYSEALNIAPGGSYLETFLFEKKSIRDELSVFLILLSGDNNVMSIFTSGGGTSIPPNALIGYSGGGLGGPAVPKYRFYDVGWSDEQMMPDTADANIRLVRTVFNPASGETEKATIAVMSEMETLYIYTYDGFSWNFATIGKPWTTRPNDVARPFDVEYEGTSGRAVLVYENNGDDASKDLTYRIYDGSTMVHEGYIDDPAGKKDYYWVTLAHNPTPGSNEVALLGVTSDGYVSCWIWNGSTWTNFYRLSTSVTDVAHEVGALAYERSTGELLVAAAKLQTIATATYDGAWHTGSNVNLGSNDIYWVVLKPDPASDDVMLMGIDSGTDLYTNLWSGTGWASSQLMDNRLYTTTTRCFDGDWMPSGSTFLLVVGDFGVEALSYKVWSAGVWTPSGLNSWEVYTGSTYRQWWIQVRGNPKNEYPYMLVGSLDRSKYIYVTSWDGSTLMEQTLMTTQGLTTYESFEIAFSYPP